MVGLPGGSGDKEDLSGETTNRERTSIVGPPLECSTRPVNLKGIRPSGGSGLGFRKKTHQVKENHGRRKNSIFS